MEQREVTNGSGGGFEVSTGLGIWLFLIVLCGLSIAAYLQEQNEILKELVTIIKNTQ